MNTSVTKPISSSLTQLGDQQRNLKETRRPDASHWQNNPKRHESTTPWHSDNPSGRFNQHVIRQRFCETICQLLIAWNPLHQHLQWECALGKAGIPLLLQIFKIKRQHIHKIVDTLKKLFLDEPIEIPQTKLPNFLIHGFEFQSAGRSVARWKQ